MNLLSVLIICLGQSALGASRVITTAGGAAPPRQVEMQHSSESQPRGTTVGGLAAVGGGSGMGADRRLDDETYEPTPYPTTPMPTEEDDETYEPTPYPTTPAPTEDGETAEPTTGGDDNVEAEGEEKGWTWGS